MVIEVICGVIWHHQHILCARKKTGSPNAGLWELPGGKLESGESHDSCLKRELKEELNLSVEVGPKLGLSEYKDRVKTIHLIAYHAKALSTPQALSTSQALRLLKAEPQLQPAVSQDRTIDFRLIDHDRVDWVEVWRLGSLQWAPADVPLIERLIASNTQSPFKGSPFTESPFE